MPCKEGSAKQPVKASHTHKQNQITAPMKLERRCSCRPKSAMVCMADVKLRIACRLAWTQWDAEAEMYALEDKQKILGAAGKSNGIVAVESAEVPKQTTVRQHPIGWPK